MPTYSISGPDGRTYSIEGPEGATREQVISAIQARLAEQPVETVAPAPIQPKESTIGGEFRRGISSLLSGARTGVGAIFGSPEEAAMAGVERSREISEAAGEGPSLSRIGRVYEERGLLPAAGQVAADVPKLLAQQAPQIGTAIAGGRLGAMAGSAFGPAGTLIGGGIGAAVALAPSIFGQSVERQAQEQMEAGQPVDISTGRAAAATLGSVALEATGLGLTLGKTAVKSLLGVTDDAALLAAQNKERLARAAEATLLGTAVRGAGRGAVVEMPVEVAQSVLERWQAGLDVTSPEALQEYGESMYAAGLVGGPLGAVGGIQTRREAQRLSLAPGQEPGESLYDTAARLNAQIQTLDQLIKQADVEAAKSQIGVMSGTDLIDMYRNQGYGAVKQYQISLEEKAQDTELSKEQRQEAAKAAKDVGSLLEQVTTEEVARKFFAAPNVINNRDIDNLGFSKDDPVRDKILNKDINNPDQAAEILSVLEAEKKGADPVRLETINTALETINGYLGSAFYGAIQQPSREGIPVAGVPGGRPAATRPPTLEPTGVVRPEEDVGGVVSREAVEPAPVAPVTAPQSLAQVGDAGTAIVANMYQAMLDAHQQGKTVVGGIPDPVLIAAARDGRQFKTIDEIKVYAQQPSVLNRSKNIARGIQIQNMMRAGQTLPDIQKKFPKIDVPKVLEKLQQELTPKKRSITPELEARAGEILKAQEAEAKEVKEAAPEVTPKTEKEAQIAQRQALITQLDGVLKRILAKYGLKDVKLNLQEAFQDEGSYQRQIITLALNVDNPVRVLRHESIHALKDMGFFSDAQWKTLTKRANDEWIGVLKATPHSETQSRYDAYIDLFTQEGKAKGLSGEGLTSYVNEAVIEEAIADAFGGYDATKAPPGLMSAILNRMKNLFKAIKEAFNLSGIETAEEIFGKIEKGKLQPAIPKVQEQEEKKSVAPKGIPQRIWDLHEKALAADEKARYYNYGPLKTNATKASNRLVRAVAEYIPDNEQDQIALMVRMNEESTRREGAGPSDLVFVSKPSLRPSEENAWQATPKEREQALKMFEEDGLLPYISQGFLDLPTEPPKLSLQRYNPEKHLAFDPVLQVPINKNGTVTVYYHTTIDKAKDINNKKVIPSEGRNRIYLTNESGGAGVLRDRGNFDQELDGSTVLVYVTPDMLQVDRTYENGRVDFYLPTAQGDFFNKKMKLQSIQKARTQAIVEEFSYDAHEKKITQAIQQYKDASPKEREAMLKNARAVLKREHNVSSLMTENGKLEKTRIGEYELSYDGLPVTSQGLGLASAQKISEKISTCPRSAICEGLCLGETSGGNFMFGGAAAEDVGEIQKSAFRAAARMMQYLKTEALIVHPKEFSILLQSEIDSLRKWAASPTQLKVEPETKKRVKVEKEIYRPAVRLNVTSDFKPEMFRAVIDGNPDVMFYDYTKIGSDSIAPNHHLTYSSTGFGQIVDGEKVFFKNKAGQYDHNWSAMKGRLNDGFNVAMAFSSKSAIPKFVRDEESGITYRVLDGDDYDARFLDEFSKEKRDSEGRGVIVGLRNKAGTLSEKTATEKTGGFFVNYDPKQGDTVVAPNQAQFKGKRIELKPEKLSLRSRWSDDRIDSLVGRYGYTTSGRENDAKAYAAFIRPQEFLNATSTKEFRKQLEAEKKPLDVEKLAKAGQEIYLEIQDAGDGVYQIVGHEGRHRMMALRDAGIPSVPVTLIMRPYGAVTNAQVVEEPYFRPQKFEGKTAPKGFSAMEMIPISWNQRENLKDTFGGEADVKFSLRAPTTPEFKLWFDDSKIVNEDGTPMVMYHGTFKETEEGGITVPRTRGNRNAFFVSPDPNFASKYALNDLAWSPETKGFGPIQERAAIYPVYIRAKNPFDYENDSHVVKIIPKFRKVLKEQERFNREQIEEIIDDFREGRWSAIEFANDYDLFELNGFDAFYTKEMGRKNLGVFYPQQIKSATGNRGTYSSKSSDIRFSLRSLVSNAMTPQVTATVNKIAPPRYDPTLWERILNAVSGDSFTKLRSQIINRYEILAKYDRRVAEMIRQSGGVQQLADQKAESAALFSDLTSGLLASALGANDKFGGAPVFRNGITVISNQNGTVKGPVLIFKPLADLKSPEVFRLWQTYVAVKRGVRLDALGKEHLIDQADVKAMKAMAQNNKQLIALFESVRQDWIKYNDALVKYMQDTGVITPKMAQEWTRHGDYFPFYRLVEEDVVGPRGFRSIANVTPPKALKGGENPLGDFFENVVRNSQAAIQAGIKNVAAQRATEQGLKLKEVVRLPRKRSGVNVYRVLENGQEVYYESADPLFIDAIKSLNMPDLPFLGLLAGPANLLRNLVTKDPAFMLANMMRDSLSAYTTSGVKMTPFVDTIKNFGKAIANRSPETRDLYAAGVLGGYDYSKGVKTSAREFEQRLREVSGTKTPTEKLLTPITSLWGALEKGTQASDAATRAEVYKRVLAETGNEAEAYWQALEVMNFNRRGNSPVVRVLTAAIPFLNARMQGLDLLYRTAIFPLGGTASEAAKQRMKTFWVRGMTLMSLSMMYWALTHDDEEYKKQEQETRDNYWLFPSLGIKIPIPFEVGVMFKVIPERLAALTLGDDTYKDFTKSMVRQLTSTFGINLIPQAALPIAEVTTNYSFFTGRSIIGKGLEDVAPQYQIAPGTSRVAEMIGQSLGMSPIKLDHLLKGYTGSLGMYASDLFDMVFDMNSDAPKASKRFEQMPIIKRFAVDPEARGTVTAYYELKDSVDEVVRTSNLLERSMNYKDYGQYMTENIRMLATKDYINALERNMKEFREMKLAIRTSAMSAEAKRDALTSIGRMESQLTQNIQTLKKNAQ